MAATLLPTGSVPDIDSGDSFWIENHHPSRTLTFVWAKIHYNIAPGKKRIVPFEVVCLYFGDPRSKLGAAVPYKDSRGSGTVPERMGEVQRLSVRYGVYEQGMESIAEAVEVENARLAQLNESSIQTFKPLLSDNFHARITDLESNPIITPLFDHDGSVTYGFALDDEKSNDIAAIIQNYERRLAALEGKEAVMDINGPNDDEGIPIDNPEGP
jgi:hypothetical protein